MVDFKSKLYLSKKFLVKRNGAAHKYEVAVAFELLV